MEEARGEAEHRASVASIRVQAIRRQPLNHKTLIHSQKQQFHVTSAPEISNFS